MSQISLGFSSCPNDTFIFDALLHGKIDTEGLTFIPVIEDVESLNKKAQNAQLDITKLSYHAFAHLTHLYRLLNAGSALGFGVGPLLIRNEELGIRNYDSSIEETLSLLTTHYSLLRIGIPGELTTANFLLSLAMPNAKNKKVMVFSEIENALLKGEIDLGLIIHENRFTYQDKGLVKVLDLGEFWESKYQSAIPLGGIVVNRTIDFATQHKIDRVLRRSVEFAFANPKSSYDFVRQHSQEMSEEVMYKHIDLYVNKYSVNLGVEGRKAIYKLFDTAVSLNITPPYELDFILEEQ
jgi:1,4-dihydroxy-6-naphthoate synthase